MSIQDITLSHACGAADAGDGALTWKMFAIKGMHIQKSFVKKYNSNRLQIVLFRL